MGFLHKLWNETLAGPMPDSTGLGELRKYDSFSARSSPPADNSSNEEMNITRSITIVRTNCSKYLRSISVDPCSATPLTAGTGTPRGDFRRRKSSADQALESGDPRSLAIYDWIVINALDR
uniref:Dormancy-associated protein homolog 4 n=1 Tax=Salix viminalis TaxID=40686 RepID=A0A6N2MU53_SALVM